MASRRKPRGAPPKARGAKLRRMTLAEALKAAADRLRVKNYAESESICRDILKARPKNADALHLLGLTRHRQDHPEEAIALIEKAIGLNARNPSYHSNLGLIHSGAGDREQAIACWEKALALRPDEPTLLVMLGEAWTQQRNSEKAESNYRKAIAIAPDNAKAHTGLGMTLEIQGRVEEAAASFGRSLELMPNEGLRLRAGTLLPVVADTREELEAAHRDFEAALVRFESEDLTIADPYREVGRMLSFLLAYHGKNDRHIQERLARLFLQVSPSLEYVAPHCRPGKRKKLGAKVRVGFVSRFFYNHTVGRLMQGMIKMLSREHFSVTVFMLPRKTDDTSALIGKYADKAVTLPGDIAAARETIGREKLDALVLSGVGMDPFIYFLSFARMAPVQCVTWGHPVTTGVPTMDYFISCKDMEVEGAQDHYSEKLVVLDSPSIHYARPRVDLSVASRQRFGLDRDAHLYICPQTMIKFHPDFDPFLAEILRRDEQGVLVLIEANHLYWHDAVEARFRRFMPDVADRVRWIPHQKWSDFLRLIAVADVMLDTLHFGGGQTTLEAMAVGTPVVTLPGTLRRNRISNAYLKKIGVEECIARDAEDYVRIALKLGTDPEYRARVKAKIEARSGELFDDVGAVRELEAFLLEAVRESRARQ